MKTQFAGNSKNSVGEAHAVLPRFTNLATLTVSDESEVFRGRRTWSLTPGAINSRAATVLIDSLNFLHDNTVATKHVEHVVRYTVATCNKPFCMSTLTQVLIWRRSMQLIYSGTIIARFYIIPGGPKTHTEIRYNREILGKRWPKTVQCCMMLTAMFISVIEEEV